MQKINQKFKPSFNYGPLSLWLIVLGLTLIRILYLWLNQRPLGIDEAQYWAWSLDPAWGYHSKGPFIAWAIYFSTWLDGVNLFAIRFLSPVAYAISALMVYFSAERLFLNQDNSRIIAFYSALVFILMPGVTFSASIISTDPFLIMFWAIGLFNFIEALQTNYLRSWVLCGIAMGLGLLAKYTELFFVLSFLLTLILIKIGVGEGRSCLTEGECEIRPYTRPLKNRLGQLGPVLALLISFLIFFPNLIWNQKHHWQTISHVTNHNIDLNNSGWHWGALFNFIGSQFFIAGPVIFILFLVSLFLMFKNFKKYKNIKYLILLIQIGPLFIAICLEGLISHAYANWAAPVYLAVSILTVSFVLNYLRFGKFYLILGLILNIVLALGLYSYELCYQQGVKLIKKDPFYLNRPWPVLAQALMNLRFENFDGNYLFDDRAVLFENLYYLRLDPSQVFSFNPSGDPGIQYDLKTSLKSGENYILITRNSNPDQIFQAFKSHDLKSSVDIFIDHKINKFYVFELENFKGY